MFHRPYPSPRSKSMSSDKKDASPRLGTVQPPSFMNGSTYKPMGTSLQDITNAAHDNSPTICGMPLKYVSLVTLAVQNAALSIVMHYSRVSIPTNLAYSPASAVLLNELLKGSISFVIALFRVQDALQDPWPSRRSLHALLPWSAPFRQLCSEIFSPDCWKLSIPAILYVVQNSLQFVAISNLPVASFQVTYQMKILTTAAFSVSLLRKKLTTTKWLSLFFLAIGVAIVQIQTSTTTPPSQLPPREIPVGSAHESAPRHIHVMSPLKGFGAVSAACLTSGLAGVYFEMVLKNSKADLWVRNVQLSLFSLIPALLPIIFSSAPPDSAGFIRDLFRNFGGWAWATVAVQVFGGLVTAIVIKYSDNILKGFATSLSIIISFLASVVLFDFRITPSFIIGASTVLAATWMYNQPAGQESLVIPHSVSGKAGTPFPGTPIGPDAPILGHFPPKKSSPFGSPRAMASALGLAPEPNITAGYFGEMEHTSRYLHAPYGSPFPSRTPTPVPRPEEH